LHQTRRSDPRRAKIRDMSRSVLPSTHRRGARADIRAAHRRGRASERDVLRHVEKAVCCCEVDESCPRCDATLEILDPQRGWNGIKTIVYERRNGDKVAPLIRWAEVIANGMEMDQARRWLRSLLPDGIIGWHAMTHLEFSVLDDEQWRFWMRSYNSSRPTMAERLESLVRFALETGRHKGFNASLRRSAVTHIMNHAPSRGPFDTDFDFRRKLRDYERSMAIPKRCAYPNRWQKVPNYVWRPLLGDFDVEQWVSDVSRLSNYDIDWDSLFRWGADIGWSEP